MFITRTNDTLPSVKRIYTSHTLVLHHHVEQHVKHGSELYLLGTQLEFSNRETYLLWKMAHFKWVKSKVDDPISNWTNFSQKL